MPSLLSAYLDELLEYSRKSLSAASKFRATRKKNNILCFIALVILLSFLSRIFTIHSKDGGEKSKMLTIISK